MKGTIIRYILHVIYFVSTYVYSEANSLPTCHHTTVESSCEESSHTSAGSTDCLRKNHLNSEIMDETLWSRIDSHDKRFNFFTRTNSSVLAYKGSLVVNNHISNVLTVFLNNALTLKDVNFVSNVSEILPDSDLPELLYMSFRMPWPIQNRDCLVKKLLLVDEQSRSVFITYGSVLDSRVPMSDSYIRIDTKSQWQFRVDGNCSRPQSVMMFEATVDLKGKLPVGLINAVQRSSLLALLSSFATSAERYTGAPHHDVASW